MSTREADLKAKKRREEAGDKTDTMDISEDDAAFILGKVSENPANFLWLFRFAQRRVYLYSSVS